VSSILIETDEHRPDDEDPPVAVPRPPRPEHRRVYTSLLFTVAILAGTVVTIYLSFPARHHVLASTVVARHRAPAVAWELPAPTPAEVRAWMIGVVGGEAPPPPGLARMQVIGAESITVLGRRTALVRLHAGPDEITYSAARARGVAPRASRKDGDLRIFEWRRGPWALVAVGPDATTATWAPLVGAQ
jgi:hypothetical protein